MEKTKKAFGGKQEGAGRKELPPELKKRRVVAYVEPAVAEWIERRRVMRYIVTLSSTAPGAIPFDLYAEAETPEAAAADALDQAGEPPSGGETYIISAVADECPMLLN
jgi:hypothetical protein